MTRFHTDSIYLAKRIYSEISFLTNAVSQFEAATSLTIPWSVKEWYVNENALDILKDYSNEDNPLEIAKWEVIRICDKKLIVFLVENQGVWKWAFESSSNDDPPVYVIQNDSTLELQLCTHSFSEFIYSWIWDHLGYQNRMLQAELIDISITEDSINKLSLIMRQTISNVVFTNSITYRFESDIGFIRIINYNSQSDWLFMSGKPENLSNLISLTSSFHHPNWKKGIIPWGQEAVLAIATL